MAESVVKLRVDSQEYDAKIRRAADGVRAFGDNCRKAGESVTKADKDTLDYVRAIGQMETVAKNAKGKINEMTNAFTDLSVQYRNLTEQERQSPFGRALAQSLDQLKARIKSTKDELASINDELNKKPEIQLPTTSSGGLLGGGKLDGMLAVFGGNMMTKAASFAENLVRGMGDVIQQGIELANAGEGIRIAFERLNRPDILDKLREATHGTVTDIELMKQAVKFNDFKLSLDEMGTMLAFAQQKAKDTGQSVDYMVDSIVTGLGRKSLMILDNLGLSAAEIKEKMAETGDMTKAVGEIIREQMGKAGDYIETTADRAARADAEVKNAMEELGRTFQPLAESGAAMFQSLEIGAIRLLTRAIQPLIDKFTTLGRLRKEYESAGGTTRVGTDIERLRNNSSNSAYRVMLAQYDREIQNRQRAVDAWHAWRSGDRSAKAESEMQWAKSNYGTDTGDITAQMNAWKKMRGEFVEQSKAIMNPVKVTVDIKDAIVGVDSLKIKLQELEAQRRNAIKAGDHDQVKNLTQQINQVKADIKGLDPTALKTTRTHTTHKVTPQERAADMVANAERTYSETLLKNSIRFEAGIDTTLESKKKELSAQERLFDAYSDAYATYKDPKYKQAIDESAEKIKSLAVEVKGLEDEVKKSKEKWERGLSGFNADTMAAWMKGRQGDLSKTQYGTAEYGNVMANIADMNTIKTILEQSMKAGIDASKFDLEPLWEKVFDDENIPDATWQKMVDVINEKLKEMDIKPIKIDFKTGDIDNTAKNTEKSWNAAARAVQAVGSALQQIEDPGAKIVGIVGQAIANIALGFAQATAAASSGGPFAWIAAIAGGLGTMVSTIAAIHSATGYAEGGIIKGSSYSGDNIMANGGTIGLNAGEVVLNRAQTGNLASQLTDTRAGGGDRQPYLDVETIWLGMSHYLKRRGMGEIVTTK